MVAAALIVAIIVLITAGLAIWNMGWVKASRITASAGSSHGAVTAFEPAAVTAR